MNQRFPVFFSEKRPFFMEGMGLFNIAGTGGDGNMRTAVHTRRIIDSIFFYFAKIGHDEIQSGGEASSITASGST